MSDDTPRLLRIEQLARVLGMSVRHIGQLRQLGTFPIPECPHDFGARPRWAMKDVEAYIERKRAERDQPQLVTSRGPYFGSVPRKAS